MEPKKDESIEETIRRFEAGERSQEVLERLNSAAFECFHAPWETAKKAIEMGLPGIFQKPLPMYEEGDDNEGDSETEGLRIPDLLRRPRLFSVDPPIPPMEGGKEALNALLERLSEALSTLGCLPFLAPGLGVTSGLSFDPQADNKSHILFRATPPEGSLQVTIRGDASLSGLSEVDLREICQAFNRQDSKGVEANTYRCHETTRLRLMLSTTIPIEFTRSPQALESCLAEIFELNRTFWRLVRSRRPQ